MMNRKKEITGLNLILMLILLIAGCKTYRNVEKLKPITKHNQEGYYVAESEFGKIKKEEKILVELTDGKEYYLKYISYSEKILHGKVRKDDKTSMIINEPFDLQIPLEKIKNVRVWKPNTALTIGIPLGILGVTVLIGLLLIESEGIGISW